MSILSSTQTGSININQRMRRYGMNPSKAVLNADGSIDYNESLDLSFVLKDTGCLPFRFNTIKGYFLCNDNNLTTLDGAPKRVCGSFYCQNNMLTSLEGGPEYVTNVYDCSFNKLRSLKGAPERAMDFRCNSNYLSSVEGCPEVIHGIFECSFNKLESLTLGPKKCRSYICTLQEDALCSSHTLSQVPAFNPLNINTSVADWVVITVYGPWLSADDVAQHAKRLATLTNAPHAKIMYNDGRHNILVDNHRGVMYDNCVHDWPDIYAKKA